MRDGSRVIFPMCGLTYADCLSVAGMNQRAAAKKLGVSERQFYSIIKKLGMGHWYPASKPRPLCITKEQVIEVAGEGYTRRDAAFYPGHQSGVPEGLGSQMADSGRIHSHKRPGRMGNKTRVLQLNRKTNMSEGKKYDVDKTPWHLCPLKFVEPLVAVFKLGRDRYGFENWKKNFDTPEATEDQRFISAIKRHTAAIEEGGPLAVNHDDGGVYHAAQIAWDALRLLWGALRKEAAGD